MDKKEIERLFQVLHKEFNNRVNKLPSLTRGDHFMSANRVLDSFFEDNKSPEAVAAANQFIDTYNKGKHAEYFDLHFQRDDKGNIFSLDTNSHASKIVSGKNLSASEDDDISSTKAFYQRALEIAGDSPSLKSLARLLNDGSKISLETLESVVKDVVADKKVSEKEQQLLNLFTNVNQNFGVSFIDNGSKAVIYERSESPDNEGWSLRAGSKGSLGIGYKAFTIDENHRHQNPDQNEHNPIVIGELTPSISAKVGNDKPKQK